MNSERLFNIIMMELTTEKMKLEENLEDAINSKESAEVKVERVKMALQALTNKENCIAKFSSLITNNNNNKKEN